MPCQCRLLRAEAGQFKAFMVHACRGAASPGLDLPARPPDLASMTKPLALIIGADGHLGAYLARLLDARGHAVVATETGMAQEAFSALGITDSVEALTDDAALDTAAAAANAVYAIADGTGGRDAIIDSVVERISGLSRPPRLIHVAELANLPAQASTRRRIGALAVLRSERRLPMATALLHAHDSRLGSAHSLPARIVAQLHAAAQGEAPPPLEIEDPGPADWGWTAEYVDALSRLAAMERPVDSQVMSGATLNVAEMMAHAGQYFRVDPTGLFVIRGVAAPVPSPAVSLAGVAGWRAMTIGKDLVQTWCEGAASRFAAW